MQNKYFIKKRKQHHQLRQDDCIIYISISQCIVCIFRKKKDKDVDIIRKMYCFKNDIFEYIFKDNY